MSSSALTFPTAGQKGGHAIFYDFWFSLQRLFPREWLCTGSWVVQTGHLTWPFWHRPPDINRRTMDRALLLFPSAEANWRLPPFLPFSSLLFLVHSTQHAVHDCKQITRMSAIHQLLPVYRCVYTPPILAWGLLSFFIPSANVFKEKSGHNEKLPDKWLRVRLHGSNATTAGQKQPSSIITRESLFIPLCLTFYSV